MEQLNLHNYDFSNKDSVSGELVFIDDDEIAILTRHERVGDVVVHFPRIGFDLRAGSR